MEEFRQRGSSAGKVLGVGAESLSEPKLMGGISNDGIFGSERRGEDVRDEWGLAGERSRRRDGSVRIRNSGRGRVVVSRWSRKEMGRVDAGWCSENIVGRDRELRRDG